MNLRRSDLRVDAETSARMGHIRQLGTSAELTVRELLRSLGHVFKTENRDLAGSPDMANRSKKWAVFVHGCFWHGHLGCVRATVPKRNRAFWMKKFSENRLRDARAVAKLRRDGFTTLVVWECQVEERIASVARKLGRKLT
jgi:DNA mismatch endonuclease (patch repair protein)